MKIYFHRTIVNLLFKYFRCAFYRYEEDYRDAKLLDFQEFLNNGDN